MVNIHSKLEIIEALKLEYKQFINWFENQPDDHFDREFEVGKWTAGQHAVHIVQSTAPINKAMRLPKLALKTMFGKNNRDERTFQEVVDKYQAKLAGGGVAGGDFLPDPTPASMKPKVLGNLKNEIERLEKIIGKWKEDDLSTFLLPHPLLGKMTLRELLLFTVYHTSHHRKVLEDRYTV